MPSDHDLTNASRLLPNGDLPAVDLFPDSALVGCEPAVLLAAYTEFWLGRGARPVELLRSPIVPHQRLGAAAAARHEFNPARRSHILQRRGLLFGEALCAAIVRGNYVISRALLRAISKETVSDIGQRIALFLLGPSLALGNLSLKQFVAFGDQLDLLARAGQSSLRFQQRAVDIGKPAHRDVGIAHLNRGLDEIERGVDGIGGDADETHVGHGNTSTKEAILAETIEPPNGVIVSEPSFLDQVVTNLIAMGRGLTALSLTRADELLIEAAFEEGIGAGDIAQIIADGLVRDVSRWEP